MSFTNVPLFKEENQAVNIAQKDASKVVKVDWKRPFSSLEDACDRLLPFHVLADWEAEEDRPVPGEVGNETFSRVSKWQAWNDIVHSRSLRIIAAVERQEKLLLKLKRQRLSGEANGEETVQTSRFLLQEERLAVAYLKQKK